MSIGRLGTDLALALLVGTAVLAGTVLAFVVAPHVAFAAAVAWFTVLETVRVQVSPATGATKELIAVAATSAVVIVIAHRRVSRVPWRVDGPALVLSGLFLGLYVFNLGGGISGESGYGAPWFHGTRLASEPLILMLAGMLLPAPRRSLRWGLISLVSAACLASLYGVVQQRIGVNGLMDAGYVYGEQVRQIGDQLRSFGTLGDPFAYAALLGFAVAALMLAFRSRPVVWLAGAIVGVGLLTSLVRTAAILLVAVLGVWLARRGQTRFAVIVTVAALVAGAALFSAASGKKETRLVQASPTMFVTLNGRTNIWKATLETPGEWTFGRGVGVVGTASERATRGLGSISSESDEGGGVVDSAYFATIADVGLVGLFLLLGLLARLAARARHAALGGDWAGWLALGFLAIILLDGVTRESFTAFPTAYVGFLILGLAAAAWENEPIRRTVPAPSGE